MVFLFTYDHLMDPYEFKQCFPNVKFKFFAIGRLDNFKINWIAKGIPFFCRARPTLIPFLNASTYGVIIEITNYEKKLISEYIKYLPNNLLINTNAVVLKLNKCEKSRKDVENILSLNSAAYISENNISFDLRVITFCTESSNTIFDNTFIDFLLKNRSTFSNSNYLIEIKKISKKISPILPSESYINLITKIARYYQLPDFYVEENLNLSSRQKLSLFESLGRKIAIKYIYLITKFKLQELGFGIIDLLWELDPRDPLVFADYKKINKKIFLITTLIITLALPTLCYLLFW